MELEGSDHYADPVYPGAAPVLALLLPHLLHLPRVRHVEHLLEPHPIRPTHQVPVVELLDLDHPKSFRTKKKIK